MIDIKRWTRSPRFFIHFFFPDVSMLFEDLQSFLQVRPGSGLIEAGDDRVTTPFVIPGVETPISVLVRRMPGGLFFVHDGAAVVKSVRAAAEVLDSQVFRPIRAAWIDAGTQVDEEGRIFTIAHDEKALSSAVARIIEAQIVLGALGTAMLAHSSGAEKQ